MRRTIDALLFLLVFCCSMRLWQYYVGIRLPIYDLLLLGFLVLFALRALLHRELPLPVPEMRAPLEWLWVIAGLSTLSYFCLDFSLDPAATNQFWKGLGELALYTAGLTALACHLSGSPRETAAGLLRGYLLGVAVSSLYSFAEVTCAHFGHDLGKAVFGRLSVYAPDFDRSAPFYYEWDVFFRAVGFTGVNSQGTYTASAIPLLLLARPFPRRAVNLSLAALCLAGTALTFSRNAFLCLFVSLALYTLIRPAWALRYLPRTAAICLPLLLLGYLFSAGARSMISTRLYHSLDEVGRGRFEVYESAWQSAKLHPLGHGLNQFSVVVFNTDEVDLSTLAAEYYMWDDLRVRRSYANLHNNWLNWLFEGGWLMLLAQAVYNLALLLACLRARSNLGLAAFCCLGGLMFSGLFNMTLDLFSTELLFILLPVCAALAGRQPAAGTVASVPWGVKVTC